MKSQTTRDMERGSLCPPSHRQTLAPGPGRWDSLNTSGHSPSCVPGSQASGTLGLFALVSVQLGAGHSHLEHFVAECSPPRDRFPGACTGQAPRFSAFPRGAPPQSIKGSQASCFHAFLLSVGCRWRPCSELSLQNELTERPADPPGDTRGSPASPTAARSTVKPRPESGLQHGQPSTRGGYCRGELPCGPRMLVSKS